MAESLNNYGFRVIPESDDMTVKDFVQIVAGGDEETSNLMKTASALDSISNIASQAKIIATGAETNAKNYTDDLIDDLDPYSEVRNAGGIAQYVADNTESGVDYFTAAVAKTSGTSSAYTATIPGLSSLTTGIKITIIPHATSTSATPTLNVNSLGAKGIRRRLSTGATTVQSGAATSWLTVNKAFNLTYDGTYWIVADMTKPSSSDLDGNVTVPKGGTGRSTLTSGSYLVGNGTSMVSLKTPSEVLDDIGAMSLSVYDPDGVVESAGGIVAYVATNAGPDSADIVADSTLSSTSTNPIQNKAVYEALEDANTAMTEALKNKQGTITGAASTITSSNLSPSKVVVTNASGKISASSTITTTELGYLNGVTSSIQTQLNNKLATTGGTMTGNLILPNSDPTNDLQAVTKKYVDANNVGKPVAGKTLSITSDTTAEAAEGAEIFNDYAERTYDAEGYVAAGNIAVGLYSHAEGCKTTASAKYAHAEGLATNASGNGAHSEGQYTVASGHCSHAEGGFYLPTSDADISEYEYGEASGYGSHVEGTGCKASNNSSHAEGYRTKATGAYSHSGGYITKATGPCSYAGGRETEACGQSAFSVGEFTYAQTRQAVFGRYNMRNGDDVAGAILLGNGTSSDTLSNAFRADPSGVFGTGSYNSSGADYAEYFEWSDGNIASDDRVGRFVTLDASTIRLAESSDDFILGIVSGLPSVIGDSYDDQWHDMYLRDIFGRVLTETVNIPDEYGDCGDIMIPAHNEVRWKINPNYDGSQTYVPRSKRPEWAAIGMIGKLVVIDDGTCSVNGYCWPSADGIATHSEVRTPYRVMERLDETHIRVFACGAGGCINA